MPVSMMFAHRALIGLWNTRRRHDRRGGIFDSMTPFSVRAQLSTHCGLADAFARPTAISVRIA